jgi:hypothetical protein
MNHGCFQTSVAVGNSGFYKTGRVKFVILVQRDTG